MTKHITSMEMPANLVWVVTKQSATQYITGMRMPTNLARMVIKLYISTVEWVGT